MFRLVCSFVIVFLVSGCAATSKSNLHELDDFVKAEDGITKQEFIIIARCEYGMALGSSKQVDLIGSSLCGFTNEKIYIYHYTKKKFSKSIDIPYEKIEKVGLAKKKTSRQILLQLDLGTFVIKYLGKGNKTHIEKTEQGYKILEDKNIPLIDKPKFLKRKPAKVQYIPMCF